MRTAGRVCLLEGKWAATMAKKWMVAHLDKKDFQNLQRTER
jgi:hypothetical protein